MNYGKLLLSRKAIINFVKIRSALFCDLPNRVNTDASGNKSSTTHSKHKESPPSYSSYGNRHNVNQSHIPGKPSGLVDKEGHHLTSDGKPDLRFKENNEHAGNPGSHNDHRGEFSGEYDKLDHHLRSDGSHDMRFKENKESGIVSPEQEEKQTKPRNK
jgi:hypothetical protein